MSFESLEQFLSFMKTKIKLTVQKSDLKDTVSFVLSVFAEALNVCKGF